MAICTLVVAWCFLSTVAMTHAQRINTVNGTIVMEINGATLTLGSSNPSSPSTGGNIAGSFGSPSSSSSSSSSSDTINMINMTNARLDSQFSFLQSYTTQQSSLFSTQMQSMQQSISSQQQAVNGQMSSANTAISVQQSNLMATMASQQQAVNGQMSSANTAISVQQSNLMATMVTQQASFNVQLTTLHLSQITFSTTIASQVASMQQTIASQTSDMILTLSAQQSIAYVSMQNSLSSQQATLTQSLSSALVDTNNRVDSLSTRISVLTATTTQAPTTTPSFSPSCISTSVQGVYTLNPGGIATFQGYCANQPSDANGYLLIAQVAQSTSYLWSNLPIGTGALGTNLRLTDAQINAVWNLASSEKRLLIRCTGGVTWGSAVANNWYGGTFQSGFRSNCVPWNGHLFEYGATIAGYGNGWYQQTGSGGCLHGTTSNLGLSSAGGSCSGDVQFFIR